MRIRAPELTSVRVRTRIQQAFFDWLFGNRHRLSFDLLIEGRTNMMAAPEDGEGAQRAMRIALQQAQVTPKAIGCINASATSTQVGDAAEVAALGSVFGTCKVPIFSTKFATSHLLGAVGGLEAIFTILALRGGILPPTLNLEDPGETFTGLDLIAQKAREAPITYAASNGFGFGRVNATLISRKWS
jgi:3-oxoacyl-[acyl-carrier-protein] synthase II